MSFDPIYDERPPRHPSEDTTDAVQYLTKVVERIEPPLTAEDVGELRASLTRIAFYSERTAAALSSLRTCAIAALVVLIGIFFKV